MGLPATRRHSWSLPAMLTRGSGFGCFLLAYRWIEVHGGTCTFYMDRDHTVGSWGSKLLVVAWYRWLNPLLTAWLLIVGYFFQPHFFQFPQPSPQEYLLTPWTVEPGVPRLFRMVHLSSAIPTEVRSEAFDVFLVPRSKMLQDVSRYKGSSLLWWTATYDPFWHSWQGWPATATGLSKLPASISLNTV